MSATDWHGASRLQRIMTARAAPAAYSSCLALPRRYVVLDDASAQPRMALVLGSGGVRSIAALGIAEVLDAEGIRPDLIVGCSSGELFGATLALGLSSSEALATGT